jgi:threonine dehydrogenase-like Zn-dependent dehydrogenase
VISIERAPDAKARRELVHRYADPFGADVVVEAVGHPSAVPEGLELCRDGGTYLVLGQYADAGDVAMNPHTITRKQLNIVGSWAFEPRHMDQALKLLDGTEWKHLFAKQVTHRFPLAKANEALQTVSRHLSGKAVIVP